MDCEGDGREPFSNLSVHQNPPKALLKLGTNPT